jgi:LysR family carnitine catabolism transcriptional activator
VTTRRNLEELDPAMSRIRQTAKDAGQSLSVGAPALVSANVLPQAIKEFRTQCPTARIQLFDSDITTLLQRVQTGKLDMALGTFGNAPGVRRIPFFRFSLMLIGPDKEPSIRRSSATWSTLNGKKPISLRAASPIQQLIDKYLTRAGVVPKVVMVLNALDTQIAMVEAGEGIAVIPSFGLPACRNRNVVMLRLVNPVVTLDFHQIRSRGRKLPPAAEEFTSFLQTYIARWAGRAGVLYCSTTLRQWTIRRRRKPWLVASDFMCCWLLQYASHNPFSSGLMSGRASLEGERDAFSKTPIARTLSFACASIFILRRNQVVLEAQTTCPLPSSSLPFPHRVLSLKTRSKLSEN